jgi:hypothetical protein
MNFLSLGVMYKMQIILGMLEKLNIKTTLHKLIKVSEDERAAIWEAVRIFCVFLLI